MQHLAICEKWLCGNVVVKVTNSYKYFGVIFTIKLNLNAVLSEGCRKGRKSVGDLEINEESKNN